MDILGTYADAVRRNHDRVNAVTTPQLGDPTPCTDWDVRTLVEHITGGYQMFAAAFGHPLSSATTPGDVADTAARLAARHCSSGEAAIAARGGRR